MFRNKPVRYEIMANDIARKLIYPLQALCPEGIKAAFEALNRGETPERVGQVLQAWMEQERKEKAAEVDSLNQTISGLRRSIEEKRVEVKELNFQIKKKDREVQEMEKQNTYLENSLALQNKTLAQLHEQLMGLLSSTQSD
jgi:hypothetical protein